MPFKFYTSVLGETSLMKAAQKGKKATVKILLQHGADVHTKDVIGKILL